MALYTLPNITNGFDDAIVQTSATLPSFIPMLLIFVFFTMFLGGFISQKKRNGVADAPMWAVLSSFATLLMALALSLTTGIINPTTLSIVVGVTIFSGVWLFTSRNRNEV